MGIESFIKDQLNNNESKNLRRWALQYVDIKKCKQIIDGKSPFFEPNLEKTLREGMKKKLTR